MDVQQVGNTNRWCPRYKKNNFNKKCLEPYSPKGYSDFHLYEKTLNFIDWNINTLELITVDYE